MIAQQIIDRAYREAAIKRLGDRPNVEEYNEGLDRLNGFLASLFGAEIGRILTDVQIPALQRTANAPSSDFHQPFPLSASNFDQPIGVVESSSAPTFLPPPNSRILWRGTTPTTVYFPQYPEDGARMALVDTGSTASLTIDANGRSLNGALTVTLDPGFAGITYFYRADLATWIPLVTLDLSNESPLPAEFDRLLVCGTAISLTALDEINPTSGTMFMYNRLLSRCKERYMQRQSVSPGGQFIPETDLSYEWGIGRW